MLEPLIARLTSALKLLSVLALALTMLITCTDVVGRFFGNPVHGAVELGVFLAALSLACSMPYTHRERAHVGVEIISMRLGERSRAVLETLTGIVGVVLFITIAWMCGAYAAEMQSNSEVSMTLQIPLHPIIYTISASFWVLALVQLGDVVASTRKAVMR